MGTIPTHKWETYFDARDEGLGVSAAARRAGIDRTTAYRFERGDPASSGLQAAQQLNRNIINGQLIAQPLNTDAAAALNDFALFRARYTGRRSTPWQERAAYAILQHLQTPHREYAVINMPPGAGKSTLFTHDIPAWLIARDRTIRIMIGSRTERQARMYVGRLKRTLEREHPLKQDPDMVAAGLVNDAQGAMADDYTPFKPEGRSDLWRHEALVVRQTTGQALDDKEPTVSAWGQDSGFLGGRFDLIIWDDLVDARNTRTEESINQIREWWTTEAETRLEPGGLLILQGQRIAADDLYRYALNTENMDGSSKYHHIVYPAHDDTNCHGDHGDNAKPWPEGCLLDPYRLPHKELERIRHNEPRTYNLMYQQDDETVIGGLIHPAWLEGGLDDEGHLAPGSYDDWRSHSTVPPEWAGRYSFITIDPSPSEYWGILWWLYDGDTQQLALIDAQRTRLTPEQFLNLNLETMEFTGLMEEWRQRANNLNVPLDAIIVEINAAQKWLLSQPHVQRWQTTNRITFLPHTTTRNKNDPEYGVETLGAWYRHGRIRLPWATPSAKAKVHYLTKELLQYPYSKTTDMLMSNWFATLHINTSYTRPNRYDDDPGGRGLGADYKRGLVA